MPDFKAEINSISTRALPQTSLGRELSCRSTA